MRNIFWGLLLAGLVAPAAIASGPASSDPFPRGELFGGYSYFYSNAGQSGNSFNGAAGSITENIRPWFGGVLDFSTQWHAGGNVTTFAYGPVFSYRKDPKITPFVHFLGGGVRGSVGYLGVSKAETTWGLMAGGGVDVKVTRSLAVRVFQADYVFSHFSGVHQDNMRVSVGLVYRFGFSR